MISLSEIFASIQGESSFAGFPCLFIRFSGCNLRCNYCDTTYSYQSQFSLGVSDILQKIKKFGKIYLVEITGGEPLLQADIYPLITRLHDANFEILLETNGTKSLAKIPPYVHKIVDVKCPESGHENSFLIENINFIRKKWDDLKFVINSRQDYDWAKQFIYQHHMEDHNILISPVYNRVEPSQLAEWIVEDQVPYRFQLQLQKYIWQPQKRGV